MAGWSAVRKLRFNDRRLAVNFRMPRNLTTPAAVEHLFPAAAQLLKPIQNHVELPRHGPVIAANHQKPLAIGRPIGPKFESIWRLVEEAMRDPEETVRLNRNRHQGIWGAVKQLARIARPNGRYAASRGDCDLSSPSRIGFDENDRLLSKNRDTR